MRDNLEVILNALMFSLFIGLIISAPWIEYKLDTSYGDVYVNHKIVYTGRLYFISIRSIGENGNAKRLKIYEGIPKLKKIKQYVSDDIQVINKD